MVWPVGVVNVKPEAVTPVTVPLDPPADGPDRAFDPPPPAPPPRKGPPAPPLPAGAAAAVLVDDPEVAKPTEIPATAHNSTAAAIAKRFLVRSSLLITIILSLCT
jgi:hypothetical protein